MILWHTSSASWRSANAYSKINDVEKCVDHQHTYLVTYEDSPRKNTNVVGRDAAVEMSNRPGTDPSFRISQRRQAWEEQKESRRIVASKKKTAEYRAFGDYGKETVASEPWAPSNGDLESENVVSPTRQVRGRLEPLPQVRVRRDRVNPLRGPVPEWSSKPDADHLEFRSSYKAQHRTRTREAKEQRPEDCLVVRPASPSQHSSHRSMIDSIINIGD